MATIPFVSSNVKGIERRLLSRVLIRWRIASTRSALPSRSVLWPISRRIARVSDLQALLIIAILVAAVMMARGYGAP